GGMGGGGERELRASVEGRDALVAVLSSSDFDPEMFTASDQAALGSEWGWMGGNATKAMESGMDGMVDDDLAYVAPWGFTPSDIAAPVLIVQGDDDRIVPRSHGEWLAQHIKNAELWLRPDDGHISVLNAGDAALDWLVAALG